MSRILTLAAAALTTLALTAAPAAASTMGTADFKPSHTMSVGMMGLSYDYALGNWDGGVAVVRPLFPSAGGDRMTVDTRVMGRFLDTDLVKGAVIGGLQVDPGYVGGRGYLVPDLGIAMALVFNWGWLPLRLRLNMSLTLDQGQNSYQPVIDESSFGRSEDLSPRPNLLQRLTTGPNTSVGIGWAANENFEVTVGGGTVLGLRLRY